jgi:hypothetical protein
VEALTPFYLREAILGLGLLTGKGGVPSNSSICVYFCDVSMLSVQIRDFLGGLRCSVSYVTSASLTQNLGFKPPFYLYSCKENSPGIDSYLQHLP